MTDKSIKPEQWFVKQLISKINNKQVIKPQYQRKKKWDISHKSSNNPNERSYIEFLFAKRNSVHAITFGEETTSPTIVFSNIDGNNRINAIQHFISAPFEVFDDYLNDLYEILDTVEGRNMDEIKNSFRTATYNEIITYSRLDRYLKSIDKYDDYFPYFKELEYKIDDAVQIIQKKLKVNGEDNFDSTVRISVNLFEGYTTDELSITFEEINKFNSRLTETELLACRLFGIKTFSINDNVFKIKLTNAIVNYYKKKSEGEALECYVYDPSKDGINAHDFIVGFQNLLHDEYKFIEKTEVDGLSLFFKLYKSMYGSLDRTFTTENVEDFIDKIQWACKVFENITEKIFTKKLNDSLFNKKCQQKIETLKKNNIYLVISALIGYKAKNMCESDMYASLEKSLLYHFIVSDIKNKDVRNEFKNNDMILFEAGGAYIDSVSKKMLSSPNEISDKLTKPLFQKLLKALCQEVNDPYERKLENGKNKNDKRRPLKFFEKTMMFYFYKDKVSINVLDDNKFSIEHIVPNSTDWDGKVDKDRTGNLIPIISSMNCARGNRSIIGYNDTIEGKMFRTTIQDVIPCDEDYTNIVDHTYSIPKIKNNELYNKMCDENESKYIDCFVDGLFKTVS